MATRHLILILGDQLTHALASLREGDPARDHIIMAEVKAEALYVRHHKKKIAFVFAAMRHFAEELRAKGWRVDYTALDDKHNTHSLRGETARAAKRLKPDAIILTEPGEWRLKDDIAGWSAALALPVTVLEDDRFICSHNEFQTWADERKQLRMEYFYRDMRRKTGLLMNGAEPEGGKWNYDADNRKPAKADLFTPSPKRFKPDAITSAAIELTQAHFSDHFGALNEASSPFWFATTAKQAKAALKAFVKDALPLFGDYQDAMLRGEKFLYHSVLSVYINAGLLDPLAVCRAVEKAYYDGHAPLNAAEGFIRQIIGWREYVRGIYWRFMPDYIDRNALGAHRKLPDFYWTGETDMACVKAAVDQTREDAYAHHIQRLMVTGNFAMLIGANPHEVHEWYLAVYADAYEWVEAPNTLGMSQFADGGVLGSKPYAASGAYINKMSDYCKHCAYDVKQKTGAGACPYNPLYWDFLLRHESALRANPRMGQIYRTWDKMDADKKRAFRQSAKAVLERLDKGQRL